MLYKSSTVSLSFESLLLNAYKTNLNRDRQIDTQTDRVKYSKIKIKCPCGCYHIDIVCTTQKSS